MILLFVVYLLLIIKVIWIVVKMDNTNQNNVQQLTDA